MKRIVYILVAVILSGSTVLAQSWRGRTTFPYGKRVDLPARLPQATYAQVKGWLTFNFNDVGTIYDLSSLANTGTPVGVTWITKTMSFDGLNDHINWQTAAADINGSSGTVCMWVYTAFNVLNGVPQNGSTNKLVDSRNTLNNFGRLVIGIQQSADNSLHGAIYDSAGGATLAAIDTTSDWNSNTWQFLTYSWDYNTDLSFFHVNAVQTASDTSGGTAYNRALATYDCRIGSRSANVGLAQYYKGRMENVMLFQRRLLEAEILSIYNLGHH